MCQSAFLCQPHETLSATQRKEGTKICVDFSLAMKKTKSFTKNKCLGKKSLPSHAGAEMGEPGNPSQEAAPKRAGEDFPYLLAQVTRHDTQVQEVHPPPSSVQAGGLCLLLFSAERWAGRI